MAKTCGYCNWHTWKDDHNFHFCLRAPGSYEERKRDIGDSCDDFKSNRRGYVGCTNEEHLNTFADLDLIEGTVKDDKYTRRKNK